jgi:hypothetical protein
MYVLFEGTGIATKIWKEILTFFGEACSSFIIFF